MNSDVAADASEQRVFLQRTFDAPRELVFKAWTEPERLAQWWGPKGWTIEIGSFNLRPGGMFHYSQRTASGQEMWGKFVYHEITPPERLVFVNSFSDAEANTVRATFIANWPLEILNILTLTEHDNKTTLTMRGGPINASEEEQQAYEQMRGNLQQGMTGTLDQLEAYLVNA